MLAILSDNAGFLIAAANTAVNASLAQSAARQSIDDPSDNIRHLCGPLGVHGRRLRFDSLWITIYAAIITAGVWAIIAAQRFVYGDPASRGVRRSLY